jgi:transposase-like protein
MDEVAELELPTQENFQYDLRSVFRGTVRLVLETVLEEVAREMIGASRWQRLSSRKDVRNGTSCGGSSRRWGRSRSRYRGRARAARPST